MNETLFQPLQLGNIQLKNRIVMPPLTRSRADQPGDIPNKQMAEYYLQRAEAGLIITEGTQISKEGQGYAWTPGIYSQQQLAGWTEITNWIHKAGGVIFAQLWHAGRISHTENTGGKPPLSPSGLPAKDIQVYVARNNERIMVPTTPPQMMTTQEIKNVILEYRQAAINATIAGFDGVEINVSNGYLINQFLDPTINQRTDEYGGSLTNRLRFLQEILDQVCTVIGSENVGVRIAPLLTINGVNEPEPEKTYSEVISLLEKRKVVYLHVAEAYLDDAPKLSSEFKQKIRQLYSGVTLYTGKYTTQRALEALNLGYADLIGFGRAFLTNPDLPNKIRNNLAWNNDHDPELLSQFNPFGLFNTPELN